MFNIESLMKVDKVIKTSKTSKQAIKISSCIHFLLNNLIINVKNDKKLLQRLIYIDLADTNFNTT